VTVQRHMAGKIFFVLTFLAFASVILASSQPPLLRDFCDWVFQGTLFAKTLAGHPVAGYALKHYPVPNSITTLGLALLTLAFGWMWAAKLWLIAYLAMAMATTFFVARVFKPQSSVWWALPAVLFFGQTFWYATISFSMGACLLLLLACFLYKQQERPATIAGFLLACFFTHLIIYAAAGVMILLYCIQHRRWRLTYIGLATLPLPLWYFAGRSLSHSRETALGYSPPWHLAITAAVAALVLLVALIRPQRALSRKIAPLLSVSVAILLLAALFSAMVPESQLAPKLLSASRLLRLKALAPFQLFGFVNIIYDPNARPLLSATFTLLRRPLFIALMLLDFAVGLAFMCCIARQMLIVRDGADPDHRSSAGPNAARFLWDFVALFSLLYLVCPPNALGMISIDLRLAQLALGPALFLFATTEARGPVARASRVLRWASVPAILLAGASLYQFAVSQRRVQIPGTDTGLHSQLAAFGAVDPIAIADEYERLRTGKLEGFIFATGLFIQTLAQPVDSVSR